MTCDFDHGLEQERCPVCMAVWPKGSIPMCICMPQYTSGVSLVERAVLYSNTSSIPAAATIEAEKMGVDFSLFREGLDDAAD